MTLRTDHVAGAAFVLFGLMVVMLSGDLPAGRLSMPGAGFLPMIVAALLIAFGGLLVLRAGQSPPLKGIDWSDLPHAAKVLAIAAAAVALYTRLGFVITLTATMAALLILIERRHAMRAALYSMGVVAVTYATFEFVLKSPLPRGLLGH